MKLSVNALANSRIPFLRRDLSHGDAEAFGKEKSLRTATDVLAFLGDDVSREDILRGMQAKYDGDPVRTASDVDLVLSTLRLLGALEE